jgi:four helix bundle protein
MNSTEQKKPGSYRDLIVWQKARRGSREFIQFTGQAEGSLAELDTQLALATELGYANASQAQAAVAPIEELRPMLNALRRKLESSRA